MIRAGHAAVALVCGCLVWDLAGSGRLGSTAAWAGDVSYRGKTVSILINSTAGGGTDMTARMVGGLMTKYLPGEPQIVFRNMPGGGGVKAGNYFASQVAPDGPTA